MNRLLIPIALVIFVGAAQIALAFHALRAGVIAQWVGVILAAGMLANLAIIVAFMAVSRSGSQARERGSGKGKGWGE